MERYRTFFPRFVALLIDSFIMLPIAILDDWFRQAEFPPMFFYIWIPISSLVLPVYLIAMHAKFGQTLGKMAMNVKVLNVSEEPITLHQAILRESPQMIFNLAAIYLSLKFLGENPESEALKTPYGVFGMIVGIWGLTDILIFAMNEKRRALHDFIAGTIVVKTNLPDQPFTEI